MDINWRDIPGFEGKYKINVDGQVYSYLSNRLIKSVLNRGYYVISLVPEFKKKKQFKLHRLLMMSFNPVDNMDVLVVDHIDCDGTNNKLSNLRWVTVLDNNKYSLQNGRQHTKSDFKDDDIHYIRNKFLSHIGTKVSFNKELAKEFDCSHRTIESIVNRKRWSHI